MYREWIHGRKIHPCNISGWIAELEITDSSGLDDLMDKDAYDAFLADGA